MDATASPDLRARALARARQAQASVGPLGASAEAFAESLLGRVAAEDDPAAALDRLFADDLYLAFACGRGSSQAMERFERDLGGEVERAFRRMSAGTLQLSDVRQQVLEKLFTGDRPKILDYSGAGPLRVWLRVASLRLLTNLVTRAPRETPLEDELLAAEPMATSDPELEHLRTLYRQEFKQAFAAAVASMGVDDRVLLHQRFAGRLSLEELAAAHEVHVNTVSRWLQRARAALEAGVRSDLRRRLRISDDQLQSILRLVQSQLDVTLGRLLP
ncbi:MAG TPA: sigma-70 family RNA polymerase sigma factor [Myxococcales bacterium]|nr:sigma-70 family RNA polymerase sigma factor [Myxococcales bacterium]